MRGKLIAADDPLELAIQRINQVPDFSPDAYSETTEWSSICLDPHSELESAHSDIDTGMSCLDPGSDSDASLSSSQTRHNSRLLEAFGDILSLSSASEDDQPLEFLDDFRSLGQDAADTLDTDDAPNLDHNLEQILKYSPLSHLHALTELNEFDSYDVVHSRLANSDECQVSHDLDSDQLEQLSPALEMWETGILKVFCDGGFDKTTNIGSYGTVGIGPTGILWSAQKSFHPVFSSFGAELKALRQSLIQSYKAPADTTEVWIFTDSQSLVQRLRGAWTANAYQAQDLLELLSLIHDMKSEDVNLRVRIRWIPGHAGIQGNELADRLATQALRHQAPTRTGVGYEAFSGAGRQILQQERQGWSIPARHVMRLGAKERRFLHRLITGYGEVGFWNHKKDEAIPAWCRFCSAPEETVTHLLRQCDAGRCNGARLATFPEGVPPTYDDPTTWKKFRNFFVMIGIDL
jgi:ribonuclease HI